MSRKSLIKISFEVDNVYNREDFREFLHSIMIDTKVQIPFEFFIVTENVDHAYVQRIADEADIDDVNIVYCANQHDKLNQLTVTGINIHFDAQQSNIKYIDDNATTDVVPILVNWLKNQDGLMKYIQTFRRVLNDFNNEV